MKYLGINLPPVTLKKFFGFVDKSGDGEIDFSEFAAAILGDESGKDEGEKEFNGGIRSHMGENHQVKPQRKADFLCKQPRLSALKHTAFPCVL